ncbi:uncharacterized protein YqhO-like, partial [Patella vulgata]|uniref:uncharacterized protein YqhO-like n=1 Tax=Patella vulgata TaxID=6465 RepID=UPI0021803732
DFENLVLEGGGNKGLAYCGAIKYLQEVGIMQNIKRIAGTSAGSMTAALFTVGYTADEIQDFLGGQIADVFLDHRCGYCSLLPNLLSGYGWNPGKKIFNWFGDKMEKKTGNPDITFKEVYKLTGIELCIVVTNLSQMSTEYCHLKTTPDMSIRLAVRMSMAIPGIYKAMKYKRNGQTSVYVDGGVLCNYPIHCFDGWYLSMAREDGFIQKLQPLSEIPRLYDKSERFGKYNPKTLGFLLFADNEQDIYVDERDMARTVGINTGHMGTTDFELEEEDMEFVVERGYNATKAYLQYYIAMNSLKQKTKPNSEICEQ